MPAEIPLERALLAGMRALLGEITPEIRVATIEILPRRVVLRVCHTGEASDTLREDLDAAGTEILAELPWESSNPLQVDVELVRSEEPVAVQIDGWPIFVRKGTVVRGSSVSASTMA